MNQPIHLPALAWVGHRRQAFSKLCLLTLRFFLLVRIARLLFRTGSPGAAQQRDKKRRNQNRLGKQLFHTGESRKNDNQSNQRGNLTPQVARRVIQLW